MKKLMMFAAAMTIVGGAYAADCLRPDEEEKDCALVYNFKASLKTTAGAVTKGSAYDPELCDRVSSAACYRKPGRLNWTGVLYVCGCDCTAFSEASLDIWNKKAGAFATVDTEWSILNLLGSKGRGVEVLWSAGSDGDDFALTMAGFGKFDNRKKALHIKSLSGTAVGSKIAPECEKDLCIQAIALICEDGVWTGDADPQVEQPPTVLAGTWALKYNKKASYWYGVDGRLPTDKYFDIP